MDIATIDVETSDPNLKSLGCGAVRGDGRILTVAIYCPTWGIDGYWTWDDFLQDEEAIALLEDESVCKVMHNGLYDLNWLCIWGGLTVNNTDDTLTRETLLDAYSYSYALQTCCDKHGVAGKNREDTIDAWWARKGHSTKAIEHLAEIPVDIVGKYNLQDVHATYELYMAQQPLLEEQNLLQCNDVERSLIPWLLKTRKQGMRIDNKALRELTKIVVDRYTKSCFTWEMKYGDVNPASNKQLQELFTSLGLEIPISAKTQRPSFDADSLEDVEHPCAAQIVELKGLKKLLGTYLEGQFINFQYKGHINGELHPAKSDDGGTVTGRFSCSNPNMQNISAREEKYGNEVRSLFIPEDGCLLGAFDYKQIEYRVFTHFAIMCGAPGADEAERQFKEDPNTDYHLMGQKLMGWYFPDDKHKTKQFRHIMKNLGFGSLYGLGPKSFAHKFRAPLKMAHPDYTGSLQTLAKYLQDMYYTKVPFIKYTCKKIEQTAERRGYIKTVSGRRNRFRKDRGAYVMINYLVQGSAGDIIKKAIVDSWKAGVWDVLIPHNMVHDELVFSIPDTKEGYEACIKLRECMRNAYQLRVPIGVDTEIGPDWGHCNEENWEAFEAKWKGGDK